MDYRKYLLWKSLSDDERNSIIQHMNHREVMNALERISEKENRNKYSFLTDLGANVAGNAAWDAFIWLGKKIIRKL